MKKKLFVAVTALIAVVSTGVGIANSGSKTSSALEAANVEALSQYETGFDECKDGCSTTNTGRYCCTLWGHTLRFPKVSI